MTKEKTTMTTTIVTISYNELLSFDPLNPDVDITKKIEDAYGPLGLGIIAVSDVPDFFIKRQALLPLAAKLPTLPDFNSCVNAESLYSVGWSHGKEELAPGKPDIMKGSFYANPLTNDLVASLKERDGTSFPNEQLAIQHPEFFASNVWPTQSLPQLEIAFIEMGKLLHHVGYLIARICDSYCNIVHGVELSLAQTIQHSLNAKGRLLHYFPNTVLSSSEKNHDNTDKQSIPWCGYHNDHGSLTGLVPGMYLNVETGEEVSCPDDETGLYIQSRTGEQIRVTIPSDYCAFQIGETSQIQSGGLLQATPHAVLVGNNNNNNNNNQSITRESFAIFLEPEFNTPLNIPNGKTAEDCQGLVDESLGLQPLKSRWKPGQTFGDFHLATVSTFTNT